MADQSAIFPFLGGMDWGAYFKRWAEYFFQTPMTKPPGGPGGPPSPSPTPFEKSLFSILSPKFKYMAQIFKYIAPRLKYVAPKFKYLTPNSNK